MDRQTDTQTDRQRQSKRQTDRQTDRQNRERRQEQVEEYKEKGYRGDRFSADLEPDDLPVISECRVDGLDGGGLQGRPGSQQKQQRYKWIHKEPS